MRLGKVLAARALALDQVRHGVETEPVDPQLEPEVDHLRTPQHGWIVVVEIGLVVKEAMPVVDIRDRIPRPVRRSLSTKITLASRYLLVRVAPDVEVALGWIPEALCALAETTSAGRTCD